MCRVLPCSCRRAAGAWVCWSPSRGPVALLSRKARVDWGTAGVRNSCRGCWGLRDFLGEGLFLQAQARCGEGGGGGLRLPLGRRTVGKAGQCWLVSGEMTVPKVSEERTSRKAERVRG